MKKKYFDNKIGLGSKDIYQSGEETDFIIRAIKKFKYKIFFDKSISVIHERKKIALKIILKKVFYMGVDGVMLLKKII